MPKDETLFKNLKEHSIAEFFRKNSQMLGYSGKIKSLTTVVHELMTNSLDACEESNILPDITVQVMQPEEGLVVIRSKDNGPGIPKQHISSVFGKMLAGTKFHRNIQLRGQQGIGVAGVTMFSQMTTGKPVEIISVTKHTAWDIELTIDVRKNTADISSQKELEPKPEVTGVEYFANFKDVQYSTGEQGPYEYLRRTALANPHAQITYIDPSGAKTIFERTSNAIPPKPIEVKPHPKGVSVDDLIIMSKTSKNRTIKGMLQDDFARMSPNKAKELSELVDFNIEKRPARLSWGEAEKIVKAFKKVKFLAPPTDCLRPIGQERIEAAMKSILAPEFLAVVERRPTVYGGGYAFLVEVGVAYGGHAGRRLSSGEMRSEIMRFANRAPLLFDTGGCGITKAVRDVDWKRYGLKNFDQLPVTVFVNLISTHIPYTGAGKQSISDSDDIQNEIRQALMDVCRKFNKFHSHRRKLAEHTARKNKLLKYVTEISNALSELLGKDEKEIRTYWENLVESAVGETIDDLESKVAEQEKEAEKNEGVLKETVEDENGKSSVVYDSDADESPPENGDGISRLSDYM